MVGMVDEPEVREHVPHAAAARLGLAGRARAGLARRRPARQLLRWRDEAEVLQGPAHGPGRSLLLEHELAAAEAEALALARPAHDARAPDVEAFADAGVAELFEQRVGALRELEVHLVGVERDHGLEAHLAVARPHDVEL